MKAKYWPLLTLLLLSACFGHKRKSSTDDSQTVDTPTDPGAGDGGGQAGGPIDPNAGAPSIDWIEQAGNASGPVTTMDLAADNSGNVYATGYTSAGLNGQTQSGFNDAFLVKYTSSGSVAWTKQWGAANGFTIPYALAVDPATGYALVGGYTTVALTGSQAGSTDVFWQAINTSGTIEHTEQAGTHLKSTSASAISFYSERPSDHFPLYVVAGNTNGWFDGKQAGNNKYFVGMALKGWGTYLWSDVYGTTSGSTYASAVTSDSSGNVIVAGRTTDAFPNETLKGTNDYFISTYDSAGTRQWAKQFGAAGANLNASAISTDSSGNIFVTGSTTVALAGNTMNGTRDCFLAKHSSSGSMVWTKQYGASGGTVWCNRMVKDGSDGFYILGLSSVALHSASPTGTSDQFIMKVDSSGEIAWVKMVGLAGTSLGASGFAGLSSNLFSIGDVTGSMPGNTGSGSTDMFVIKYSLP